MNQIDMHKLLKMLGILALIFAMVSIATHFRRKSSMTLDEYARLHPSQPVEQEAGDTPADQTDEPENDSAEPKADQSGTISAADFYFEPLSRTLQRYITGVTYPADETQTEAIPYDELRYVHIIHYNFDGVPTEGELICNAAIAQDLVDIFYELYRNGYQIEKALLPEEYDGDTAACAVDNDTFCFTGRDMPGEEQASGHALGLALHINPMYNPRITYDRDGARNIFPDTAEQYADRDADFAYKIDENDLCCRLFLKHGFVWGGNRNAMKDYGLFQKNEDLNPPFP